MVPLIYTNAGLVLDLGTGAMTAPRTGTYLGFEQVYATDNDDSVTGTDAANDILLFGGDDTVHAAGGDDVLSGYSGDDLLDGGDGDDRAFAGRGTDSCPAVEHARSCEPGR